ncbi:hypothetical protein ES703_82697 [subsurface metagenome]
MTVVKPGPEFDVVAENELGEETLRVAGNQ